MTVFVYPQVQLVIKERTDHAHKDTYFRHLSATIFRCPVGVCRKLSFAIFNSCAWRAAEIPSANGTTNARALARLYGALANGGEVDGVRVLSPALLTEATAVSSEGTDQVFGFQSCIGLGFSLNRPAGFMGPNTAAFGHAGYGESIGFADSVTGIGFGFVTNSIPDGPAQEQRAANLIRAPDQAH